MLERIPPREWKDLLIAWLAISLAFTLIFLRDRLDLNLGGFLLFFGISLGTVGIGFVLHEMAHKFTAMKYGYWAEFHKDPQMLLIAVILAALVGVVFAAPGATMIYGSYISREQNAKISLAGPLTNLALCLPFALLLLAGGSGILYLVGMVGLQVNAMIAFFNMIPVSVLDGKKVFAWSVPIFALVFAITLGILVASLALI